MELNMDNAPQQPLVSQEGRYLFPAYWGGMTVSTQPPKIHAALTELRREVGSLAAKKQQGGPMFPVRSAKELMQKLAEALDKLGLQAFPVAQEVHHFDTSNIPSNATASGKPVFRTLAHVKATVRVGAADGSYIDVVGSGHGGDVDDKAGGKADTYAWKSALLKGLCVPEQDMPDTDDDSSDSDISPLSNRGGGGAAKTVPSKSTTAPKSQGGDTAGANVADVIKQIEAADEQQLEQLKADVVSGKIPLAGADRLKASTAFVKRKNAHLEAKAKTGKNDKETK